MSKVKKKTTMSKEALRAGYVQKAMDWIVKKGYLDIKADLEGMELPKAFVQKSNNTSITPDLTARSLGRKFYFEVAMKSPNSRDIVTKWKFLSQLAAMKDGKLIIFAPHGHRSFAEKLVETHKISARVVSLRSGK